MKTRVLEVLASLKRAGAERTAVTLATGLPSDRFECEIVSLYDAFPGGFEPELGAHSITVHHLGKRRGFDPRMVPRLARVMRKFRPHVVHTHSYVLRYAWPAANAPLVHTVHNLAAREVDTIGRMLHRLALNRGVRFVAISSEVARSFRDLYRAEPAALIPNGIDLAQPTTTRDEWRRSNGFPSDDILIASVARLDPQKNPLLLIDALPDDPRCHLLLAGQGALAADIQNRHHPRVHILGVRSDIPDLLQAIDIFALASDYEGLPVALIEAMQAGLPIVATNVGGVPELTENLLVPARDRTALHDALNALITSPKLRTRLGAECRERSRNFTAQRMVAAYAALFEQIRTQP